MLLHKSAALEAHDGICVIDIHSTKRQLPQDSDIIGFSAYYDNMLPFICQ